MDAVTLAMINALGGGGSGSLPSVTSADNGKVLGVVDGAWAADSNYFLVTITGTTPNKTNAEIERAYLSGKNVYALYSSNYYRLEFASSTKAHFALIKQDTTSIQKIGIENGTLYVAIVSALPPVTASDNGAEAIVKNGSWVKQKKKFIVTLTPTSPDYSGTMDKTVAEINAAYEAGQEIVFRVVVSANEHVDTSLNACNVDTTYTYPSFDTYLIEPSTNVLVRATTEYTNDGTQQTYSTKVYSLTPAS